MRPNHPSTPFIPQDAVVDSDTMDGPDTTLQKGGFHARVALRPLTSP
jgi:hypothetical protein